LVLYGVSERSLVKLRSVEIHDPLHQEGKRLFGRHKPRRNYKIYSRETWKKETTWKTYKDRWKVQVEIK